MSREVDQITDHIPRLRRYARALLGDGLSADDLVQDTLERALSRFSLWRRHSDMRAWLFTIMHNLYVNQGRSARRRQHLQIEMSDYDDPVMPSSQEGALAIRDMNRALALLPDEYREVILLVGLEQMQYDEVARVLAIPRGTVMSRLSRGRERLRQIMSSEGESKTSGNDPVLRRVK